jgi:uncharacterized protein (TIGR02145 family)
MKERKDNSHFTEVRSQKLEVRKYLKAIILLVLSFHFSLLTFHSFSQVGINTTGSLPDNSAILDVSGTNRGLLLNRMTTEQRNAIASPATSLLIFNTTTNCFEAYVNGGWFNVSCPAGCNTPSSPTPGTNTPSLNQIVWNWNSVSGASGYQWNTTSTYPGAGVNASANTSYIQSGLSCGTFYSLYVWSYNTCGRSSNAILTQTTSSCNGCGGFTTMTDSRDSKTYNIVQIGTQCWMAQNLNYGTYVPIHSGTQAAGTKYCQSGTDCGGSNDPSCPLGGLYEWNNMMNGFPICNGTGAGQPGCNTPVQGLCPNGWHVPSHYEWTLLEKNVGSCPACFPYDESATGQLGVNEGDNLKTSTGWIVNTGTNSSGFTAKPDGQSQPGDFSYSLCYGYWWTSSGWARVIYYQFSTVARYNWTGGPGGLSVRCLKN